MYRARLERLQRQMAAAGFDGLIAITPENFLYTTGAYIMTQKLIRDRLALCVVPASGEPTVIVCNIEESLTRAESPWEDVRIYVEFKISPVEALTAVLQEKGLAGKRVGMEKKYITAHYWEQLTKAMPATRFEECKDVFNRVRVIKDSHELELLEFANRTTTEQIMKAFRNARPGDSERKVSAEIMNGLLNEGFDEPFLVLGRGPRTIQAHPIPSLGEKLTNGDVVRVDCGGLFKGYFGDVARTVCVGQVTEREADIFKRLAAIQRETIESAEVGVQARQLFELCKSLYAKNGLPFHMPHIGHSMGVELHEDPMLNPFTETPLEENMVLNIEPIVIVEGRGYHIEDLVHVTANGPRVLNRPVLDDEFFSIR